VLQAHRDGALHREADRAAVGAATELTYWTEKLRQAEQELDAARTRTALGEAARKFQQARAELKRLEMDREQPKRRASRGSRSASASSPDRSSSD
jgi:hypothetical protein